MKKVGNIKVKKVKIALVTLLILIGLGYAALRAGLNINGTANVASSSWDVHFENLQNTQAANITPTSVSDPTSQNKLTTISYEINLEEPGDVYEFTVDVVNAGSIDAMIESISSKYNDVEIDVDHPVPNYIDYSVTYSDGEEIEENHLLSHNTRETYKVHIGYKEDISVLPSTSSTLQFDLTVDYVQANENAIERGLTKLVIRNETTEPTDAEFEYKIGFYNWETLYSDTITSLYRGGYDSRVINASLENANDKNTNKIKSLGIEYDGFNFKSRFLEDGKVVPLCNVVETWGLTFSYDNAMFYDDGAGYFEALPNRMGGKAVDICASAKFTNVGSIAAFQIAKPVDMTQQLGPYDKNRMHTFTLKSGETKSFSIPHGYEYTIISNASSGWSVDNINNETGIIAVEGVVGADKIEYVFTNKKNS